MANRCTFFGHRDAPSSLQPALAKAIEQLLREQGIQSFLVGGYGNFDRMAAASIQELKKRYANIELCLVTAYFPRSGITYEGYDQIIYPEGLELVPQRFAISHRNRRMVEMADFMIAYVGHTWGGAAQAFAYGRKIMQASRIINLYPTI